MFPTPAKRPNSLASSLIICCDLDGPLIDVSDRYYRTYCLGLTHTRSAFQAEGINLDLHLLSKPQFWHLKRERTADTEIALRSGLQLEQVSFFLSRVQHLVNQPTLLQDDLLQPGVRRSLALLQSWGAKLIAVTLRQQTEAEQVLKFHGLDQFFSRIRGSDNCHAAYQNYAEHKQQLLADVLTADQVCSERTWMIGDTEADVLSGQAIGLSTIALTCGIRSHNYLTRLQPTRIHQTLLCATHDLLGLTPQVQQGNLLNHWSPSPSFTTCPA